MLKIFAFLLVGAVTAKADVEFVGVSSSSVGSLFVIADTKSNATSDWLEIGDGFEDYVIKSFDKDSENLKVSRNGKMVSLHLRASHVLAVTSRMLSVNSKERWAPILKKKFDKAEVVLLADVVPRGNGVVFKCIKVLKSQTGGPVLGQVFEFGNIDKPVGTGSLSAVIFLNAYPPTDQIGPEFNYFRGGLFRGFSQDEVLQWMTDQASP
jgi:hypothetical protein